MQIPPPHASRNVHDLLGLPFDAITLEQAVAHIRMAAQTHTPCFFSTPNLNFLIASQTNAAFRQSVVDSDLSLADGMPIVWLAKLLAIPLPERVAGSDVFEALRQTPIGGRKIKVYFFGGPAGVAQRAAEKINTENGGMVCVGYETPGFGSVEDMSFPATLEKINASGAEFLVVALGAVKGQAWILHNRAQLKVPVVSHLGAVVNFVAGNVQRAPLWMQKTGLEWLWRVKEEPGLWARYFNDGVALLKLVPTILGLMIKRRFQKKQPNK
jgi:N-acetylglucosaminyldiphosphoundecaprenol N-acetyl-beta-D-mannosaminyltransferase